MAEEIRKVVVVDTTDAVKAIDGLKNSTESANQTFKSMKEYKAYIDKLTASLYDLEEGSEEYAKTVRDIQNAQNKMNSIMYDTKKKADAAEGSYDALTKQMSELKKQWKATADETERAELGKKILSINDELKELDSTIGNNQRNVGNYETAFTKGLSNIADGLDSVGISADALKKGVLLLSGAFKTLLANPIVLAIGAVVGVFTGLAKAFKSNEEASNKLKVAFSGFNLILKPLREGLNWVVDGLADIFSYIPKVQGSLVKFRGTIAELLNKIGIVSDEKLASIKKNINDTADAIANANTDAQRGIKIETELASKRRKLLVDEAKYKKDIEELNAKIADEEKYSASQRAKFADEAEKIAKKMYDDQKAVADLELEVANLRIKNGDKSTEALDAQAEAQKKVYELEEQYNAKQATLISQRVQQNRDAMEKNKEISEEEVDWLEKQKEREIAIRENELARIKEIEDEIFYAKMANGDKTKAELTKKYNEELELLIKHNKDTKELTDKYIADMSTVDFNSGMSDLSANDSEFAFLSDIADKTIMLESEKNLKLIELDRQRLENKRNILSEMLALENLNAEQYTQVVESLMQTDAQLAENSAKYAEANRAVVAENVSTYSGLASSLAGIGNEIASFWKDSIDERVESGELSEKEAEKEFERVKALQISMAIINGLAGIATAVAQAMTLGPVVGPIVGSVNAALVATTTALQVAEIKKQKFKSSGSSTSSSISSSSASPTSAAVASNPSYTSNVTGASEEENLKNAIESGTRKGNMDMRVYVVESDIREAGKKAEVRDYESTF